MILKHDPFELLNSEIPLDEETIRQALVRYYVKKGIIDMNDPISKPHKFM